MTAPKMCLQVLAKLSGAWLLLLAILVLSSSANRATARPVVWQSLTAYPSPVHARFLQQSVNGTEVNAMVDRSAKPATPMTRLGEELPDGVSATSADVGNITVSMTIQGNLGSNAKRSLAVTTFRPPCLVKKPLNKVHIPAGHGYYPEVQPALCLCCCCTTVSRHVSSRVQGQLPGHHCCCYWQNLRHTSNPVEDHNHHC